jgi:NDP-sugar pyrophosphorylase family protein
MAGGYRAEAIRSHFGDGSSFGARILYSVEKESLGRGGALKLASSLITESDDLVVAVNGDTLTGQLIEPMVASHRRTGAIATVMVARLVSPYGITQIDRTGRIVGFVEKPRLPYWLNAGLYVLTREFFDRLPPLGDHETTAFPQLALEGKLYSYRSAAYWRTIDTMKDLLDLEREIQRRPLDQRWPPVAARP